MPPSSSIPPTMIASRPASATARSSSPSASGRIDAAMMGASDESGPEHQDAGGPEDRVRDQRHDRGVEARLGREPGHLGVAHARRDEQRRDDEAGADVRPQPRRLVRPRRADAGQPPIDPAHRHLESLRSTSWRIAGGSCAAIASRHPVSACRDRRPTIVALPSGSTVMSPVTRNGTSSLTWLIEPSKSERMSTSMWATASAGGIVQPRRPARPRRSAAAAIDHFGGEAMRSSTMIAERARGRLQHLLRRAAVEELLDPLLHDRDELRRSAAACTSTGIVGERAVREHGDARGRRDRRVDRDRVDPRREDEQRHRGERVGVDARRARPAACRSRSR